MKLVSLVNKIGFISITGMFRLIYRILFALGILSLIVSCQKNEDYGDVPVFELTTDSGFINGYGTFSPGELMNFKVQAVQGGQKLTNFFIEVRTFEGDIFRQYDTSMYCSEFHWEGSFYKSSSLAEQWMFVIQDRRSRRTGDILNIYADTVSSYKPLMEFEAIELGAQNNPNYGGFYSLEKQMTYFVEDAKTNQEFIDLVFYHGEDEMTMSCPNANIEDGIFPADLAPNTWDIRNTTRYIKTSLTNEDFDSAQNDSILIANYIETDAKRKAKNLIEGDIVVFKNQQGLLGMFRINSIEISNDGKLDIDLKVQTIEE